MLERLDKRLVRLGLAKSRDEARGMIEAGEVRVGGIVAAKPASMVDGSAKVEVDARGDERWVSRGAHKLLKGLDSFGVDPSGSDCVDIGASTGGFTQVLLSRGANRVAAVDVGYGQLAWSLRNDPRVIVIERTNARSVTADDIGYISDIATIDASFISLRLLLPNVERLIRDGGQVIALVKPQFEAGRGKVGRGVVRDPSVHESVLREVAHFADAETGLSLRAAAWSPIKGPMGNIEFIFHFVRSGEPPAAVDIASLVEAAHAELDGDR